MNTRHLVDPELLAALDAFPQFELSPETLAVAREGMRQMSAAMPVPEGLPVDVEERRIEAPEGHRIGVLVYRPHGSAPPRPAVLHIHGGGYILGSMQMMDGANRALAADLGCLVVSVDYRLAPETPHPGPVEDCYKALRWLHANASALGADAARIAVSGESAGGGLAAALALLARDRGEVPLVFQRLIYPMLDDRTCTASDPNPFTGEFVWTRTHNRFGWRALLGHEPGAPGVSPYAAAARAEDLSGLPPAFISVGTLDLFFDENLEYARRLVRAGVPTELHVYPGAFHGSDAAAGAAVTVEAQRNAREALRRAFSRKSPMPASFTHPSHGSPAPVDPISLPR